MKSELYTFYDKVADQSGPISHARNEADAIRSFCKAFEKDPKAAGDYRLLHLGTYDHDTSIIDAFCSPEEVYVSLGDIREELENG